MTETTEKPAQDMAPERWITGMMHLLAATVIVAMMLHISVDVALRWFLGFSLVGTLEYVSYYYMVAVVFLPLCCVQQDRGHVIVEVFSNMFPVSVTRWVDRGALLFTLGYVGFIGWWGLQEALRSFRRGEVLTLVDSDLVLWPSRLLVPIGLFAMAFIILLQLVRSLRGETSAAATNHGGH